MSSSTQQLERMLALVPYIQSNGGVPVSELAARFGVSRKQIQRELIQLTMTGTRPGHADMIDIDYEALDEGMAFLSNAEFMTRPLRLTVLEGASLNAAMNLLRQIATPEQQRILDRVITKVHSALSAESDSGITVHVEAPSNHVIAVLNAAINEAKQVKIRYATDHSDSESERVVDPSSITIERGFMYLSAWCHLAEGERIFRLDRIRDIELLTSNIEAREHEVPEELFDFGAHGSVATLRVEPSARWIVDPCQTAVVSESADGLREVQVHAIDSEWLVRLVLLGAGSIRVLSPEYLAQQVRDTATVALAAYDRD